MHTRQEAEQITELHAALWPRWRPSADQLEQILKRLSRHPAERALAEIRRHYQANPDENRPKYAAIFSELEHDRGGPQTRLEFMAEIAKLETVELEYSLTTNSRAAGYDNNAALERDCYADVLRHRGVSEERIAELVQRGIDQRPRKPEATQ